MENISNSTLTVDYYIGGPLWITVYSIIIVSTVAGNILTICAIISSRQLFSMISNQFIFSLGLSDLLVGITIPYHMCFYLIETFMHSENTCLVRFVLISFACASSILNLFFIAADRYWAVVYPLKYNRCMTRQVSIVIIGLGWILSLTLSTVPIYWNSWTEHNICDIQIIPEKYFNYVLTPLFVLVWITILVVYIKIWREAVHHAKRIRQNVTNLYNNNTHQHINDTKSIQVVMMTLGCFSVCWMPYFIVTTYYRITDTRSKFSLLYEIAFTMAVANSGMNPLIYAWKNSNFRRAFWCLLTCHSPNNTKANDYITNHVPSKKNSIENCTNGSAHIEMDKANGTKDDSSVSTVTSNVNSLSA